MKLLIPRLKYKHSCYRHSGRLCLLVHIGLTNIGLLPLQASVQAVAVDQLLGIHFWLISFLLSLIMVTLFYSLIVFRRKKGETGDGAHIQGNSSMEVAWTAIPLLVVIILGYIGARSLGEVRRIDPSALKVKVISGQWFWQFQYPEFGVASTELHLPVDRQVDLQLTSQDVIHSFWCPNSASNGTWSRPDHRLAHHPTVVAI
jgi:cytochrome c oxidase subunit 2